MTKKFVRSDYSIFAAAVVSLDISEPNLCEALGYSRHVYKDWERAGNIPKVASLAIECLRRRISQKRSAVVKAAKLEVIEGDVKVTEVHPGIWVLEV